MPMSDPTPLPASVPSEPGLDRSFWGMAATQFLGAFNDNLFKQVVLLMCLDYQIRHHISFDLQPWAQGIFAAPFILFSGLAGYLADCHSKRNIVVLCKAAEIGIVLLGIAAIASNSLWAVFAVLFLLGTHSAFFGPSKYGILPELVGERRLSAANGIFLMTTFVAIITGIGAAGILKQRFLPDNLAIVAVAYVGVSLAGLATSLLVRKTPAAHPRMPFHWENLAVSRDTIQMFRRDRPLLLALVMFSVFWLIGGVVQPAVNAFGVRHLGLTDEQTSFILVFLTVGIALGCIFAGWASGERVEFRLVRVGAWGMVVGLALMSLWGGAGFSQAATVQGSRFFLFVMGAAAGMFTVPLQVYLQSRPPMDQKGRVIGAMNLINWIGIALATPLYALFELLTKLVGAPYWGVFGATALVLVPVALFYRPRNTPRPE
jgi:acyl-[acyl-carrier-protein]-phospholipid O-acyltransferase/long-chain-fatty-acid--[acyl-carrier-protein] ligase